MKNPNEIDTVCPIENETTPHLYSPLPIGRRPGDDIDGRLGHHTELEKENTRDGNKGYREDTGHIEKHSDKGTEVGGTSVLFSEGVYLP